MTARTAALRHDIGPERGTGRAQGRHQNGSPVAAQARRGMLALLGIAFILSLAVPAVFFLGPVRLSPYRIVLLVAFVPAVLAWLSGRSGTRQASDWLMVFAFLWGSMVLLYHHGGNATEASAIYIIEGLGAYFLARAAIRSPADYIRMVRLQFLILLATFPAAVFEARTGRPILIELFAHGAATITIVSDPGRLGLQRVQGTFEHSILYGVFCASALAGVHYALAGRENGFKRLLRYPVVFGSVFMSLSSGAFMAAMVQLIVFIYDRVLRGVRHKWRIFGWGLASMYVAIDLASNRTPFHVISSYLTFNSGSAYNRILIWRFGSASVREHPILGLGYNDWARPDWMGASVDNFWLLVAMQYGLPGVVPLMLALFLLARRLSVAPFTDPAVRGCRAAWLTVIGALVLASGTVHFWNTMYVWFLFLIGSSVFMLDRNPDGSLVWAAGSGDPAEPATRSRGRSGSTGPDDDAMPGPAVAARDRSTVRRRATAAESASAPAGSGPSQRGRSQRPGRKHANDPGRRR